jgi:shikimate kinase
MLATFLTLPPDSVTDPTSPHIVLIGLPGAGKTTVAQGLAAKLRRAFLDFDKEIERREGSDISTIFAEKGEPYFREKERALTHELADLGGMILSPGGGWIENADSVALLRFRARLVYLKVRPETALKRLGPERSTRPLLMRPDPLGELRSLLATREAQYERAHVIIDTDLMEPQQVIDKVAELAAGSSRR